MSTYDVLGVALLISAFVCLYLFSPLLCAAAGFLLCSGVFFAASIGRDIRVSRLRGDR